MSEDTAEVIQGRLGWERGDVSEAKPGELEPQSKNREIYGDTQAVDELPDTFVESVKEKGVLEPIVITDGKQIISGHRRWIAAKHVGLDSIPIRYAEFEDELAEREALIEFNRQREKTPGQLVNEFEEMLAIERERAKERKEANLKEGDEQPRRANVCTSGDEGKARDKAAEKIDADVSGWTLEKGKTVKEKAESDDEPEEVREAAQEAWEGLQSGEKSFNGAYEEVNQAEREHEEQQQQQQRSQERQQAYKNSNETVTLKHDDFRDVLAEMPAGSVDHIVTDPPYDEDSLELWAALGAHASEVLKDGGFLIAYSGKAHLPKIHDVLSSHLNYHWQAVVQHAGPGAKIFSRKLRTGYKPILIYSNGDADVQDDFVTDVIDGGGREKDDHDWQQAESEAAALIERFTEINDRICDPMCGSGTIGVAADRLNRRCLLIDKDNDAVETAKRKVIE